MIVRKLKVTVLTLFITFSTLAQEAAYYKVFGKQDGLQIGYIRSMAFDQDQFLWLAGGVNESRSILLNQENTVCLQRFDGVNFHAISLPKEINSVNAIYKRADGKFYLVSNKNLYLFDPMSTQLTLINLKLAAANHGDIGNKAVDLSIQTGTITSTGATGEASFAAGEDVTASGRFSVAIGVGLEASGDWSVALGDGNVASALDATAFGGSTKASAEGSTSMGILSVASGYASTAMGNETTAESYGQTTLGLFNTPSFLGTASSTGYIADDRLFVVGNGTSVASRSDALVILKSGKTTINNDLVVNGNIYIPTSKNVIKGLPDYVFESYYKGISEFNPTYTLASLDEVEQFVKTHKHLPGVQSREHIKEKGKWDVTENVRTNLEKVEELFLHTIEQQKEIEFQKANLIKQQKEIDALKQMVQYLINNNNK